MEGFCKNLESFCYKSGNWNLFRQRLDQVLILNDEKLSPERRRVFLLINLIEDTFSLLIDLCFPRKASEILFEDLCKPVSAYFKPVHNIHESRESFYNCKQSSGEIVKELALMFKNLSVTC